MKVLILDRKALILSASDWLTWVVLDLCFWRCRLALRGTTPCVTQWGKSASNDIFKSFFNLLADIDGFQCKKKFMSTCLNLVSNTRHLFVENICEEHLQDVIIFRGPILYARCIATQIPLVTSNSAQFHSVKQGPLEIFISSGPWGKKGQWSNDLSYMDLPSFLEFSLSLRMFPHVSFSPHYTWLSFPFQTISLQTATSPCYDRLHRPLQHSQVLRVQDWN